MPHTDQVGGGRPEVTRAYGAHALGYSLGQGQLSATPEWQREMISRWALRHDGALLDLGCGPGHLTAFLADQGRSICGVDPVAEFLDIARHRHPDVEFVLGDTGRLPEVTATGILAWYSLIHMPPEDMPAVLTRLHQHLRPGGGLLLSMFTSPRLSEISHPMGRAWAWPLEELGALLEQAGFVVDETRSDGSPPLGHGFLTAHRPG